MREALAGHLIDGYVIACTADEFERYEDDSYSSIHDAFETGHIAYTRRERQGCFAVIFFGAVLGG